MSLITRCPACGTLFKVVPDQLRISDGWVRCGHCAEIFDAHQHMQALAARHAAVGPVSSGRKDGPGADIAPPARADEGATRDPVDTQPADIGPTAPPPGPRLPPFTDAALRLGPAPAAGPYRPVPVGSAAPITPAPARRQPLADAPADELPDLHSLFGPVDPEPESPTAGGLRASTHGAAGDAGSQTEVPVPIASGAATSGAAHAATAAADPDASPVSTQAADAALHDLSFVRQARRQVFWRRPAVRALLTLLLFAFSALLLAQFAVHERDRIAALRPDLEPWLNRLCQPLGCAVKPLRQIEALVIDGSAFGRLRDNAYRLDITLRNQSPLQVAMSAVELTVTDAQDQPLVRRVLLPEELGARRTTLAGGAEWSGQAGLALDVGGARVAGYRMLIFYP